jgi:hypothetical protein
VSEEAKKEEEEALSQLFLSLLLSEVKLNDWQSQAATVLMTYMTYSNCRHSIALLA